MDRKHTMLFYPYLLVLSTVFGCSNSVSILIEPSNMTIAMGDTVRFRCHTVSNSTLYVNWIRQDTIISNNFEVFNAVDVGRYSVIGATKDDHDLQIIDVKPYDEAAFKCQATETDSSETVTSPFVYLTVQYPPGDNALQCRGIKRLEAGYMLAATCILSELGVPPAEIQWVTMDGENVTDTYKDLRYGYSSIVLRFNKTIAVEDNGREFSCLLHHPLLTKPMECKLGPLEVYHAPLNVTIASSYDVTNSEGDDLEFRCSADVNPEYDVKFNWSTKPRFKGKIIYADGGTTIHFNNVPLGLNSTILTCNATNSRGFSSASTVIFIMSHVTHSPPTKPTKMTIVRLVTLSPGLFPDTYIIVFILIGVIFVLLLGIVVILVIGRKWREPVIHLDVNDEVCRRSLSGGGSLVIGSGSHSIILHHTPNSERHLFDVHQGKKDCHSTTSSNTCCSHHSKLTSCDHDSNYPSDPQKAAKIEGTEFNRSAHTSRHNSVDSDCSEASHYERSICSSTYGSRPATPSRSRDPLPLTPVDLIPMSTLNTNKMLTLEDEEHHAESHYYMNSSKRKSCDNTSPKRESGEHKYEDLTPVTKRKLYNESVDTGEEDFPDDDRPRVTPEQFLEVKDNLMQ